MRIIARHTLTAFALRHPETRASLEHWYRVAKAAEWSSAQDVVATFSNASTLNAERVRFKVAGNDYRMIVAFDFQRGVAFIKFIGTHAEYDRIDALNVAIY